MRFNKTAAFLPEASRALASGKQFCMLMGDGVGDCTMADGLELPCLKVGSHEAYLLCFSMDSLAIMALYLSKAIKYDEIMMKS